ncbi:hypothetical protein ABK040_013375 [Willaertia magna]
MKSLLLLLLIIVFVNSQSLKVDNIQLPILNYNYNQFNPILSEESFAIHHKVIHQEYVNKVNSYLQIFRSDKARQQYPFIDKLLKLTMIENFLINFIYFIHQSEQQQQQSTDNNNLQISNLNILKDQDFINAFGGFLNHKIFWKSIVPPSQYFDPSPNLESVIEKSFKDLNNFKETFKKYASQVFGSGWVYLIRKRKVVRKGNFITSEKLNDQFEFKVFTNENSPYFNYFEFVKEDMSPASQSNGQLQFIVNEPVFGIDLWEHTYYLEYQNDKNKYFENIFNSLNWKFIENKMTSSDFDVDFVFFEPGVIFLGESELTNIII